MNAKSSMSKKLNLARQELLDLGLRNPLLNYRTLKARGLEIMSEKSSEVFRNLVLDKRKMTFLEVLDRKSELKPIRDAHVEEQFGNNDDLNKVKIYSDTKLQTNYNDKQLQSRLLATYTAAKTYIEEQGVNILYLAFGMLKWYESDQSQEIRKAPLLLVPVQLERVNARERFTMTYTEDEVGHNISLVAKMKTEFGIEIPDFDEENNSVNEYFENVKQAVEGQSRWSIDNDSIVIGFFSFGKFLMYWDLDVEHWPEHTHPLEHSVLKALLQEGFQETSSKFGEEHHLDQYLKYGESNLIKDADSSQILAILDANQGRNLVIQGPPGTGKSQTITNLIADAIGHGKKVLFVSEKMAALEVVKRRLDEVGLGVACLELHSHKTNKKILLRDLANTLDLGKPLNKNNDQIALIEELRDRLNRYCEAMNTPVSNSGATPYKALGELAHYKVKFKKNNLPRVPSASMSEWSGEKFTKREALIEELQSLIQSMGIPSKHPFWGSKKKVILPGEIGHLEEALEVASVAYSNFISQCFNIAESTKFPTPKNCIDAELFLELTTQALNAPKINDVNINSVKWLPSKDNLFNLVDIGLSYKNVHSKFDELLVPTAWEQEVLGVRLSLLSNQDKWWRFFSKDYRLAKRKVKSFLCDPKGNQVPDIEIIDAILKAQSCKTMILEYDTIAKELFASYWNSMQTDWNELKILINWVLELHQSAAGKLPSWSIDFILGAVKINSLDQILVEFKNSYDNLVNNLNLLVNFLELDGSIRFENKQPMNKQIFTIINEMISLWREQVDTIHQIASFNQVAGLCLQEESHDFAILAESWELASMYLLDCFRWNWYQTLVEKAFREREVLSQFDGSRHEQVVKKFSELDKELIHLNRLKLTETHWTKLPRYEGGGQLGILQREMVKKTRHLPIRKLMQTAGNAIQAIKPVFMMGPLSIATFIPPGSLDFDLVIFDEASQVKPVDAFGAIIRGKQTIVVGDSKQMPPTNFFDSLSREDESDEDDYIADMESILGLFVGQNAPQRMLRWHYRSRHESLITVSNHEFYDNKLVVFPSPDGEKVDSGLIYRFLPETSYDRGRTRTNKLEAKAVAHAVMHHAKNNYNLSLGVAAFSMVQMQAIMDEVEMMRRADPSTEAFFIAHAHEPFFVKNLENVQGDERDVIFISIGYGKTAEGYLAMDFGALNREGGERRLNVLITRARIRCEVFTNLKSDDIDLARSNARGVKAFKTFLKYAEKGHLDIPTETGKDFDSPFEEAVYKSLIEIGYQVQKQVGSAGFFVDLAVIDPVQPGRYLLGIECDGATYHSARSARDRDRLRQEVLEGLGWNIQRIWSTDWFKQPERELKRVVEAIEKAKVLSKLDSNVRKVKKVESQDLSIKRDQVDAGPQKGNEVLKYKLADLKIDLAGKEFHTLPIPKVKAWVNEVVRVEAPVHVNEVIKRICDAAGLKRVGTRIQSSIEEAIRVLVHDGSIKKKDEFLWLNGTQKVQIRNRSEMANKKAGFIAPQEIEAAIIKIVEESFGITTEAIPQPVSHLFGFSRLTEDMKDLIEKIVTRMTSSKKIQEKEGQLLKV